MLAELHVRNLGVIADLTLVLDDGMTALTGETGAGKTLLVEAIELLVGGRPDAVLVRPGADEATVEGRFVVDDREVVVARAVPARGGRSRAYLDGRMVPVATLAEVGAGLVDLHGQHSHQSLLHVAAQRAALDTFAGIDLQPLAGARAAGRAVEERLAELGGDERGRAREMDLLRFQIDEIDGARLDGPDEELRLAGEEERLADATAHRQAAWAAYEAIQGEGGEGGAADAVGGAIAAVSGRSPLAGTEARLRALAADAADVAAELRAHAESIEDDPARLEEVRERRASLRELGRKYGDSLADVIAYGAEAERRLEELAGYAAAAAAMEADLAAARGAVAEMEREVGAQRRAAAPRLARDVAAHLRDLAMPHAALDVLVGDRDPGDEVAFLLAANRGEPALPLSSVASGGELARAMLAARLVLSSGPATLVFDEVDAGVGGAAALAVGRALSALASQHQVLVVTHLPQVAAFADHQVAVSKGEHGGRTVAAAQPLGPGDRVVELSRMLSGSPGSKTAHGHAEELLAAAARERGR
jgi:DNA repair protein RecN (Recombination protein N)